MGGLDQNVTDPRRAAPALDEKPIRPCPVCGSVVHDVLYEQRFEHFAAGSITDAYDVVACRICGMCFASGLPDHGRFGDYYEQSSKYDLSADGAELSPFDAGRYADEARFLAAHIVDRHGPFLDIGTATGAFLVALRDCGFTSVHGVEPSGEAARVARETRGLDVATGDARAARAWGRSFATVSLVAVLEHLVDPGAALREAAELLVESGRLYVVVPDAARFRDHVDAPYQQFSVEHINYFTPASLKNLVAFAGFEVEVERATIVEQANDADGPAVELLCHRTNRPSDLHSDSDGVGDLRGYIARSAEKELIVLTRINELAEDQSPIYVWGTGTHALHLLATSRLAECNIVGFLDSNPHYAGRRLAGRMVMAPRDVERVDSPILVASAASQTEIAETARRLFGHDVPLILMY